MSTARRFAMVALLAVMSLGFVPRAVDAQPARPAQSGGASAPVDDDGVPSGTVVHSWALTPAGSSNPSEPGNRTNLSYDVAPGAELNDAVTLFNYSNVQLSFQIYATDAVNNEDGDFDLLPAADKPKDVGTWITVPQSNITLAPRSQATFPIKVKIPKNAKPGDHAGAILASSSAQGTGPDGKIVVLDRRTGSRIYVRIAGKLRPKLAVSGVTASYEASPNPLKGDAHVSYKIENQGNVRLKGTQQVSFSGPLGVGGHKGAKTEIPELLPGESVTLEADFKNIPASVLAFATVDVDPAVVVGEADDLPAVSQRAPVFAPPVTILLVGLIAAFGLYARRAYRRHRRPGGAGQSPAQPQPQVQPQQPEPQTT